MIKLFFKSVFPFLQGIAATIVGYIMSFKIVSFDDGSSMYVLGIITIIAGGVCLLLWATDVIVLFCIDDYSDPLHWISLIIASLIMMCFVIGIGAIFEKVIYTIIFAIIWIFVSLLPNGFIIFIRGKDDN